MCVSISVSVLSRECRVHVLVFAAAQKGYLVEYYILVGGILQNISGGLEIQLCQLV